MSDQLLGGQDTDIKLRIMMAEKQTEGHYALKLSRFSEPKLWVYKKEKNMSNGFTTYQQPAVLVELITAVILLFCYPGWSHKSLQFAFEAFQSGVPV